MTQITQTGADGSGERDGSVRRGSGDVGGELSGSALGVFYDVYNTLGHGFLESVYKRALAKKLAKAGLATAFEVPIEVVFEGEVVGFFRGDVVVEKRLLLEVKACPRILPEHEAQLVNYLKATGIELGLILNFGPKPTFRRMVFTNRG